LIRFSGFAKKKSQCLFFIFSFIVFQIVLQSHIQDKDLNRKNSVGVMWRDPNPHTHTYIYIYVWKFGKCPITLINLNTYIASQMIGLYVILFMSTQIKWSFLLMNYKLWAAIRHSLQTLFVLTYIYIYIRLIIFLNNFIKGYWTIYRFEEKILNFQMSQTRISKFSNVLIKGNPLGFAIKSCQNFQNTTIFIF
jgi:hypothetical protein